MLDHEQGVAKRGQLPQGLQQPPVVPRVESYAGFVEDVHHASQACPNLSGKANPLGLASRECAGSPVEGEVVEAYERKEPET